MHNLANSRDEIRADIALDLQLALLAGNEPPSSFIEVRALGNLTRQEFYPVRDRKTIANRIRNLAARTDVYIGCAPRTRKHGGNDAIARVWALWADFDDGEQDVRAPVPPNIVVRSGRGVHVYWMLREPLKPAAAVRANKRLACHLGADPVSTDAARILRPVGSLNHKHDPPKTVECTRLEPRCYHDAFDAAYDPVRERGIDPAGIAYTASEIVGRLPDPDDRSAPTPPTRPAPRADDVEALRRIDPAHYVEKLTGQPVPRHGKIACPFHEGRHGGTERTPSLHVYPTPEAGWRCYGCNRGGDIFNLAAALWGLDVRADFPAIKQRLTEAFNG